MEKKTVVCFECETVLDITGYETGDIVTCNCCGEEYIVVKDKIEYLYYEGEDWGE